MIPCRFRHFLAFQRVKTISEVPGFSKSLRPCAHCVPPDRCNHAEFASYRCVISDGGRGARGRQAVLRRAAFEDSRPGRGCGAVPVSGVCCSIFEIGQRWASIQMHRGDWRSGSALRSHRRGHWFEPSIAHRRGPFPLISSGDGPFSCAAPASRSFCRPPVKESFV